MSTLANQWRPKTFSAVIGQEKEKAVLEQFLVKNWIPPAMMFVGPFGTGKTTFARLMARALLCTNRQGIEPCGECDACRAMDNDNHQCYTELDAASQGLIDDVRKMLDYVSYRKAGKLQILCYDESHMLSTPAQNALLQTLETGVEGVCFMFCTTEAGRMLPTIRSRCQEFDLKLLTATKIAQNLQKICEAEGFEYEPKALNIVGTYVRGHVRDSIIMLEQLSKLDGPISEEKVRTYLRLDKYVEIYKFLTLTDKKERFQTLEELLCDFAVSELTELMAQTLVNAYKLSLGLDQDFSQIDKAWLGKITNDGTLLQKAEQLATLNTDFSSIVYGMSAIGKIFDDGNESTAQARVAQASGATSSHLSQFRKPTKESTA